MTTEEMNALSRGDLIQNAGSGMSYIVLDVQPDTLSVTRKKIIAVRTITVSNPAEWELVAKVLRLDSGQ